MDRYMLFPSGMGQHSNGAYVLYADAQATIAALQARVKELEEWVQDQSTANLETMRHMDEMQSRAMDAESQLTQRTAELEAVKADTKNMLDVATSRLREQVADLQAELERVRGELAETKEEVKRCGTCQWFKNDMHACGDCNYPLPQWLKFAVDHAYRNAYPLEVLGSFTVDENEGKDCPTWHAK